MNTALRIALRGGAAAGPLLASINTEGWSAEWASGTPPSLAPDTAPQTIAIVRAGYNGSASAVSYAESRTLVRRKRQVYPNQATPTPTTVALDDYIYATDSVAGVVNTSTMASPRPIAAWAMPSRLLVGNAVDWELVAFHRDARSGRQVACVRVRGNDGTTQTGWQTVSTTAISTSVEDAQPIEVFKATLDVSALATGRFWLEAEVYPWIGAAAAVLRSEDQTNLRDFYRAHFVKNVSVAASPPLIYVASSGSDSSGVVSTSAATAAASPCLTIGGALVKARTALGGTSGAMDGLRIRIVDAITAGNPSYNNYGFGVGSVIIERAPGSTRAAAIVTIAASFRPMQLAVTNAVGEFGLLFKDVSIVLGGAFSLQGEATCKMLAQLWNCSINFGGFATGLRSSSHIAYYGVVVTSANAVTFSISAPNGEVRAMRGVTANLVNGAPTGHVTIGCQLTQASGPAYIDPAQPVIVYGNKYLSPLNTNAPVFFRGSVSGGDLGGIAIVQNLIEETHTSSASPGFRVASDSDFGNITHAVIHHNTVVGASVLGRSNVMYDEHPSVARFHKLQSFKANIFVQLNTKGDIFQSNGARTGQFAMTHGVGCQGNFTMFATAAPASEAQTYPGLGCTIGTSTSVRNDPLFVSYQATTYDGSTYTAGAGGGDYRLQAGSPARGIGSAAVLGFDQSGAARGSGAQAAGGYA